MLANRLAEMRRREEESVSHITLYWLEYIGKRKQTILPTVTLIVENMKYGTVYRHSASNKGIMCVTAEIGLTGVTVGGYVGRLGLFVGLTVGIKGPVSKEGRNEDVGDKEILGDKLGDPSGLAVGAVVGKYVGKYVGK